MGDHRDDANRREWEEPEARDARVHADDTTSVRVPVDSSPSTRMHAVRIPAVRVAARARTGGMAQGASMRRLSAPCHEPAIRGASAIRRGPSGHRAFTPRLPHRAVARVISGIAALAMMLAPLAACAGPTIDVDQLRSQAQSTLESCLRDAGDGLRQLGGEFLEGLLDTDAGTTADGRSPSGSTDAGANPNGQSQGSPGTGTGDGANSDDAFSWWESASPGSGTSNGRTLRFGTTKDTLPAGYSYTQLDKTTGEAALADSCDPISYAVADGATDAQVALVDRAVSRIAEITGLRFQKVGHVEDSHADGADGASGDDPAQTQYLFSFLDAAQYPNFTESAPNADGSRERTLGETRSRSITGIAEDANGGDLPFIYYAAIALNQAYFGDGGDAWGDQDAAVEVIEHELAHALGLGHTEVPGSMMNPYADGTSGISDTDMQALRALVRECLA